MLTMSISSPETSDRHAGLRSVDNIGQIDETWELQRDVVAERLRQGHVLHGLVDHGDLCGYCWVSRAGSSNDVFFGRRFNVPEAAVYIWDCATLPRYRNRGYYKTVLKGGQSSVLGSTSAYVAVDQRHLAGQHELRVPADIGQNQEQPFGTRFHLPFPPPPFNFSVARTALLGQFRKSSLVFL